MDQTAEYPWTKFKKGQRVKFEDKDVSWEGDILDTKYIKYKDIKKNRDGAVKSFDADFPNDFENSEVMHVYIKRDPESVEIKSGAPSYVNKKSYDKQPNETYIFLNPKATPENAENIQHNNMGLFNKFKIINNMNELKTAFKAEIRKVIKESTGEDKLKSIKSATLNGKTVEPDFGFYNGQLKAVISTPRPNSEYFNHEFYNVGELDEKGNVELSPEKGKKGMYTESVKEHQNSLRVKDKLVKTYTQNGDKSYNVVYDDGSKDTIYASDPDGSWDEINQLHKSATSLNESDSVRKLEDKGYKSKEGQYVYLGTNPGQTFSYYYLPLSKTIGVYKGSIENGNWMSYDKDIKKFLKNNELIDSAKGKVDQKIDELARVASVIKIGNKAAAEAYIAANKGKWVSDMVKAVLDAGDAGITQPALATAIGKGSQQTINPKVREMLSAGVFTQGEASIKSAAPKQEPKVKVKAPTTPEEEDDLEGMVDDYEFKDEEDDTPEDEDTLAAKATPNKGVQSDAKKLDKVLSDMKALAADYKAKKGTPEGDSIVAKLKDLNKEKTKLEKTVHKSLGSEDDDLLNIADD